MIAMQKIDREKQIEEVLSRGVSAIYPSKELLRERLLSGEPLRIYLGADPTGPHLHLGHLTNLLTLKRLQKLGHEIIFLIGDFTGRIGDPTDKMAPRQALTAKEVKANMRTFEEQALCIIKRRIEIRFNSEWYEKKNYWTFEKFIMDLLGYFSVQNMIEREDFKTRLKENKTIRLQEFIYPLLQGYDGVELRADIEVGGNDQIFNMSVGRALRKAHSKNPKRKMSQEEKFFIATTLLEDPNTGKKLMNKSEGGLINLDDSSDDIFGKVMALSDEAMFEVGELCTEMSLERLDALRKEVNPREAKAEIAKEVVATIYGSTAAEKAEEKFTKVFVKKEVAQDVPALRVADKTITPVNLVFRSGVVKSMSEARRLIIQGGLRINDHVEREPNRLLALAGGEIIKIGKRHFFRVK